MNKYALLSGFFTLVLALFQFIPLGLQFGSSSDFSCWLLSYFGVQNPVFSYYSYLSMALINFENTQVFIWGIIIEGEIYSWLEIHLLSFILLFCSSVSSFIISFLASKMTNKKGKNLLNLNLLLVSLLVVYVIIGIPIYSTTILGTYLGYFSILLYFNYGFFILILILILSILAFIKHPIE